MSEEKKTASGENTCETGSEPQKKKKTKKADSELEVLKAELAKKDDLLARTAAEFDNFKKRTERERLGIAEFAKADVAKKLLPIIDNIDRAAACEAGSDDYIKGIELIVKQFGSMVQTLGLVELAAVGDSFDPNFHEAVMHIEDEEYGENTIVEVLQKGYKLGDTVIRAAMVKVAN